MKGGRGEREPSASREHIFGGSRERISLHISVSLIIKEAHVITHVSASRSLLHTGCVGLAEPTLFSGHRLRMRGMRRWCEAGLFPEILNNSHNPKASCSKPCGAANRGGERRGREAAAAAARVSGRSGGRAGIQRMRENQ
jgi:hypothetical protein